MAIRRWRSISIEVWWLLPILHQSGRREFKPDRQAAIIERHFAQVPRREQKRRAGRPRFAGDLAKLRNDERPQVLGAIPLSVDEQDDVGKIQPFIIARAISPDCNNGRADAKDHGIAKARRSPVPRQLRTAQIEPMRRRPGP